MKFLKNMKRARNRPMTDDRSLITQQGDANELLVGTSRFRYNVTTTTEHDCTMLTATTIIRGTPMMRRDCCLRCQAVRAPCHQPDARDW
jgi:hypothetical protein